MEYKERMLRLLDWKFRASSLGGLCGTIKPNLTDKQVVTLEGLQEKQIKYLDQGKSLAAGDLKKLGSLLSARDAKPKLLGTATKLCDQIIQEQVFGRTYELKSKYLDKGISQEIVSLQLYQEVRQEMLFKNEKNYSNDFFTGTPDSLHEGRVIDAKTSWDYTTFPMHDTEIKNNGYIYQLQAYMNLTGLRKAELTYCLVDTPFKLIDDELKRVSYNSGALTVDSLPRDMMIEIVQGLIYTEKGLDDYCDYTSIELKREWFTDFKEIRAEHRIKSFQLDYDEALVKQIQDYVILGRGYIKNALTNLAI